MSNTDSPTPDSKPPMPWWKLHLLTWLAVGCVAASLVVENVEGQVRMQYFFGEWGFFDFPVYLHGWPFTYLKHELFNWPYKPFITLVESRSRFPIDDAQNFSYSRFHLALNVSIAILLLLITMYSCKCYLRRSAKWHQFSINSILALTGFVAVLCANGMYGWVRWRGDATWEYVPFAFIAFGGWCTFWTAWTLMGRGIKRLSEGRADG